MPTEEQRECDRQSNARANAALAAFERSIKWSLSIEAKAMFLSGYIACEDERQGEEA